MQSFTRLFLLSFIGAVSLRTGNGQDSKIPFTIDRETTHITGPVGEDGSIDYIEALSLRQREGVTPENNSVVMFRRAFGNRDLSQNVAVEYYKQLGIDVPPDEGDYLIGINEYARSLDWSEVPVVDGLNGEQVVIDQHGEAESRPWTQDEFPLIARWIDLNEKPLMLAIQGSLRPKYFSPLLPNNGLVIGILLPDVQNIREIVRLLTARAMLKLGKRNAEGAWHDVMACHRIARLVAQGPTLIEMLSGIATEARACKCDNQITNGFLTAERALRFSQELRVLGDVPGCASKIDVAERYMYLDVVENAALQRIDPQQLVNEPQPSDEKATTVPTIFQQAINLELVDWDLVLRMGNEEFDRAAKIARLPTRLERQSELARLNADLEQMQKDAAQLDSATLLGGKTVVSRKLGKMMIGMMLPAVMRIAYEAEDRNLMRQELSHCAFALAAWRADCGEYPEQLGHLAPEYLQHIPIDIYTGQPLIYRRSDFGYLLYGVGPNLKDNDGFTFGEGTDTDDLVVRSAGEDQRIGEAARSAKEGN
ncbi:MAG: hypothetical protein KDB01_20620 [Planctomycetaceae bacterium]|nr:hypothetical protein [Planctomycetaceae bacterium]